MAQRKPAKETVGLRQHQKARAAYRSAFPKVAVLTGDCEFLRSQAVADSREAWEAHFPGGDVVVVRCSGEARPVTLPDIVRELSGGSLFGKEKLVLVRDAGRVLFPTAGKGGDEAADTVPLTANSGNKPRDREKAFVDCLEKPASRIWLLLETADLPQNRILGKRLKEHALIVPCPQPNQRELAPWLQERAKQAGKILADTALDLLFRSHGSDPGLLASEVDKLILFADAADRIDAAMVGEFLTGTIEFEFFGYTNAIEQKNLKDALFFARRIAIQGSRDQKGKRENAESSAHRILAMLATTLQNLMKARLAASRRLDAHAFAGEEKIAPYRAEMLLSSSLRYSPRELRRMLSYAAEQIRRSHDTGGDVLLSLELMAVQFAGGLLK